MRRSRLDHARIAHRLLDRPLHGLFLHMMAARLTAARISRKFSGRKHILPAPFVCRIRIFRSKASGKYTAADSLACKSSSCSSRALAKCACQRRHQLTPGNIVTLSLKPLPSRIRISRRLKSTSFTRNRRHSIMRIPEPYNKLAISQCVPASRDKTACTSSRFNTTGKRLGALACSTLSSQGQLHRQHLFVEEQQRTWPDSGSRPQPFHEPPNALKTAPPPPRPTRVDDACQNAAQSV